MHSLLNFTKFNKECKCWYMNFIDIKMHGTTIKKKLNVKLMLFRIYVYNMDKTALTTF